MTNWALKDLDLTRAVEVIPSQDPGKALRFNIPVPDWLDGEGKPRFVHENIRRDRDDGSWRFYFYNFMDDCEQATPIDGSSVITFMGEDPARAQQLAGLVLEYTADPEQLTPEQLADILERSHAELKLTDRFDNKRAGVDANMHPYAPLQTNHKYLGGFLPRPAISTAVYLPGEGYYLDGPTETPQQFDSGAFISFPGQRKEALLAPGGADQPRSKLIQAGVFINTRTYPDGSKIVVDHLVPQPAPPQRGAEPVPAAASFRPA